MIHAVLIHRATIRRSEEYFVNGMPQYEFSLVAENVPCLLDARPSTEPNPLWSGSQQQSYDRSGLLVTAHNANVLPGDRVIVTRPQGLGTYLVGPDPSVIAGLSPTVSHREYRVTEVPG